MTIGRTLAFTFATTVLVGSIPGVAATCWIDSYGYENCDGLSNTVRIIIGISAFLGFIVLMSVVAYLRRRTARTNLVYLQRVPQERVVVAPPQYPAQTYDGPSPNTAFVQVRSVRTIAVVQRPASPP